MNLEEALRSAALEDDLKTLNLGLDTSVEPRGVKLSGGQAQRTAAAPMFVRDAELLVIDDLLKTSEEMQCLWQGEVDVCS